MQLKQMVQPAPGFSGRDPEKHLVLRGERLQGLDRAREKRRGRRRLAALPEIGKAVFISLDQLCIEFRRSPRHQSRHRLRQRQPNNRERLLPAWWRHI